MAYEVRLSDGWGRLRRTRLAPRCTGKMLVAVGGRARGRMEATVLAAWRLDFAKQSKKHWRVQAFLPTPFSVLHSSKTRSKTQR